MEKEILEILKSMQNDMKEMQKDINGLKEGQERIENKLDGVVEQTADLTEFRTTVTSNLSEIKRDMYRVEEATANNWADIAKLKAVK
ncbi:MAG: hypothetical protein ACRC6D_04495 [Aeromonas sp.]